MTEENDGNFPRSVENFEAALQEFVASNTTTQDRHELVQQLSNPTKPQDVGVQAFYYRLMELNNALVLLPGAQQPLTNDQLKQSFYDGMPAKWKERFVNSGAIFDDLSRPEIIRYMRNQEKQAQLKRRENEEMQAHSSPANDSDDESRNDKKRNDNKRDNKRQKGRISDDDPCPVHPGGFHKWGDCRANHFGKANRNDKPDVAPPADDTKKQGDNYAIDEHDFADNFVVDTVSHN
ncbi:MAG: hypothetical protein SGARI_004385 [Bacillariaceae sp.]